MTDAQISKLINKLLCFIKETESEIYVSPPINKRIVHCIINYTKRLANGNFIIYEGFTSFTNEYFFGKQPLMSAFCDSVEAEISEDYANPESIGQQILANAELWPFREGLIYSQESLKEKTKILVEQVELAEESFYSADYNEKKEDELKYTANTLRFLALVMSAIYGLIQEKNIGWCAACFRRRSFKKKYCSSHSSFALNDTEYKKSRRINSELHNDDLKFFRNYQAGRLILGENPLFNELDASNNILLINKSVQRLYLTTLDKMQWAGAKSLWCEYINTLPYLAKKITDTNYQQAENWENFISMIYKNIKETLEKSTHPFYFAQILVMADKWFEYETITQDRRTTDTKDLIINLYLEEQAKQPDKKVNQSHIAKELGITRARVSAVLQHFKK